MAACQLRNGTVVLGLLVIFAGDAAAQRFPRRPQRPARPGMNQRGTRGESGKQRTGRELQRQRGWVLECDQEPGRPEQPRARSLEGQAGPARGAAAGDHPGRSAPRPSQLLRRRGDLSHRPQRVRGRRPQRRPERRPRVLGPGRAGNASGRCGASVKLDKPYALSARTGRSSPARTTGASASTRPRPGRMVAQLNVESPFADFVDFAGPGQVVTGTTGDRRFEIWDLKTQKSELDISPRDRVAKESVVLSPGREVPGHDRRQHALGLRPPVRPQGRRGAGPQEQQLRAGLQGPGLLARRDRAGRPLRLVRPAPALLGRRHRPADPSVQV